MYFPEDRDTRQRFYHGMFSHPLKMQFKAQAVDGKVSIPVRDLDHIFKGREIDELGLNERKILRDGITTGHWLHYRIWAARNAPKANKTNKWEKYFTNYVLKALTEKKRAGKYSKDIPITGVEAWYPSHRHLVDVRNRFMTVAHFWAAFVFRDDFSLHLSVSKYLLHRLETTDEPHITQPASPANTSCAGGKTFPCPKTTKNYVKLF